MPSTRRSKANVPPKTLPRRHRAFLRNAVETLRSDSRIAGLAIGGSYLSDTMDEFSDLDLIVVSEPAEVAAVLTERHHMARSFGPLLSAFAGEHVGEPRLLVCLYGPPLLHVDLKFLAVPDLARRVENPVVLWERDGSVSNALREGNAAYPGPGLDWIEKRFWVWIHYGAGKIARGEMFEAFDLLSFLRGNVLGPLCLLRSGARPSGVRRIEIDASEFLEQLQRTVASHDAGSCFRALRACVDIYRIVRLSRTRTVTVEDVERAVMKDLDEVARRSSFHK